MIIAVKKINFNFRLKIDKIDSKDPTRYPKKFHEAIKPPFVLLIFNSSNMYGKIGV